MNQRHNLAIISGSLADTETVMNQAQTIAWTTILNYGNISGQRFIRQRRVGNHLVHFLCRPLLLIVDIESDIQTDPLWQLKSVRRTMELRNMGFYTMRFYEKEINNYPNQVKKLIQNRIEILAMKQRQKLRPV